MFGRQPSDVALALVEAPYLPLVGYFAKLVKYEKWLLEACESYPKQTLRNRTYILTANGVQQLTVPVRYTNGMPTGEVAIDYGQTWVRTHIRAIESAYRHSPYFEYYFPYFQDILAAKPALLLELNRQLLATCNKMLRLKVDLGTTVDYLAHVPNGVADLRSNAKTYNETDQLVGIVLPSYRQVFGQSAFVPNLSILDLLFNLGPDASLYLARL